MNIEPTTHIASPMTTLVLLDPTSDDGEAPLHALTDDDHHVQVVVLLSGRIWRRVTSRLMAATR